MINVPKRVMLHKIQKQIKNLGMFSGGEHVLVAVSGGADSVALLLVLCALSKRLKIQLTCAHLDHRIRGSAAVKDAAFVGLLAKKLGIPVVSGWSDVPGLARRRGISVEMAAREARYAFFRRTAKKVNATVVATAHTKDDQAETVLLKLLRGAGTRGLGGMAPVTERKGLRVVRPLLETSREQLVAYLQRERQAWREDETNSDTFYLRNRVRHELLPLLEQRFNPRIREVLFRTADVLREEAAGLDAIAREALETCMTGRRKLEVAACGRLSLAVRRQVFRLWLAVSGVPVEAINYDIVDRVNRLVMGKRGSGSIQLGNGRIIGRRYESLVLSEKAASAGTERKAAPARLAIPGETLLPEWGLRIVTSFGPGVVKERGKRPGALPARASIRWTRGKGVLSLRCSRPGDRMKPFGLKGSKKLQDLFVDTKIPADERGTVPLITDGKEIIWIPGYRIASGREVTDSSEPILQILVERIGLFYR